MNPDDIKPATVPKTHAPATSVEASVQMINEFHRSVGVSTRSVDVRDMESGEIIRNLPAAPNVRLGDIVRVSVEVIRPRA